MILNRDNLFQIKGQIKNIIFDFGGVLFDINYHKPIEEFRKLGIANFDQLYDQASQSEIFDDLETGKISKNEFVHSIQNIIGKKITEEEIINAWNSILIGIPKERIDRVKELSGKYRTFIFSNTNEIHVAAFEEILDETMGLDYFRSAFEKIHYSNVLGMKKPDPDSFISLCQLNKLTSNETLFVDDSIQHVVGASRAGLFSYHLDLNNEEMLDLFKSW